METNPPEPPETIDYATLAQAREKWLRTANDRQNARVRRAGRLLGAAWVVLLLAACLGVGSASGDVPYQVTVAVAFVALVLGVLACWPTDVTGGD